MAGHQLIDQHLAELRRRLPAEAVEELDCGLTETWHHHRDRGLNDEQAAVAAIAEFGTPRQIIDAFAINSPGRRTARLLLTTGPAVGIVWGASLITAKVWTWPVPPAALAGYGAALVLIVACLFAAATTRHNYRRTRLGGIGAIALATLDVGMLTAVALLAPVLVWPMALAIPASLARIVFTLRRLPAVAGWTR
jgi:hypothetical protein